MCIEYEEMKGFLHYYAQRFQNKYHEKWELINEAWLRIHNLNEPKYLSNGIRWAMHNYIKESIAQTKRGRQKAQIASIDEDINNIFCHKDNIFDPLNNYTDVDNLDELEHLGKKLTLSERLLLDQRYYQGMKLEEIGKMYGVTRQAILMKLQRILKKMKKQAA